MPKSIDDRENLRDITLVVRRTINASPERLFDAWTEPAQLRHWWGPAGVICTAAEVDLKVGGRYRIGNQFPDGTVVWISGQFERIERPKLLVYSWSLGPQQTGAEQVTVAFEAREVGTEVIVTHERIGDVASRDAHEKGWIGCLKGLGTYLQASR
jgi:uncharacterized protein YndB with AHSA1/START domain